MSDHKRLLSQRNARIVDQLRSGATHQAVAAMWDMTVDRVRQIQRTTPPSLEPAFANRATVT